MDSLGGCIPTVYSRSISLLAFAKVLCSQLRVSSISSCALPLLRHHGDDRVAYCSLIAIINTSDPRSIFVLQRACPHAAASLTWYASLAHVVTPLSEGLLFATLLFYCYSLPPNRKQGDLRQSLPSSSVNLPPYHHLPYHRIPITMKCHKPNTDQEVEFTIFANGIQCDEYVSPSSTSDGDPNVLECFVPVTEGDRLTVSGSFTGTLLHGSFDLLADGSFLADKRIEGSKSGESKYYKKRKLDIKTVFDTPAEEGRTSIFSPDKVVEGNLYVKALRDAYEEAPSNGKAEKLGVGSLAIICSFNQDTHKKYTEKYPSITCGDWASRSQDDVADGGIAPSYEAGFKITNEDVSKTKQQKHKRHNEQTRFGPEPWAKVRLLLPPVLLSCGGWVPDEAGGVHGSGAWQFGDLRPGLARTNEKRTCQKGQEDSEEGRQ